MRTSRFGGFLLATGAAVGVAAVVGLVLGFEPSRLPPALLDVAAYKLTFAAAAGLLAAGAMIRRRGNRKDRDGARTSMASEPEKQQSRGLLGDARDVEFAPKRETTPVREREQR